MIKKEFDEAAYDLEKSKKAFEDEDYKWCIVKAYYCIFHSARAALFKLNLREKRHFAISVVLEDLNKSGKIERKYINYFNAAISSREDADYNYTYSPRSSEDNLRIAEDFKEKIKELINNDL